MLCIEWVTNLKAIYLCHMTTILKILVRRDFMTFNNPSYISLLMIYHIFLCIVVSNKSLEAIFHQTKFTDKLAPIK